MSKLLRETDSDKVNEIAASVFPMNNANIVALLKQCQGIVDGHAQRIFQEYMSTLDEVLDKGIDNARSNQEVTHLMDLQRLMRRHRNDFQKYFCGYVSECYVKFKRK